MICLLTATAVWTSVGDTSEWTRNRQQRLSVRMRQIHHRLTFRMTRPFQSRLYDLSQRNLTRPHIHDRINQPDVDLVTCNERLVPTLSLSLIYSTQCLFAHFYIRLLLRFHFQIESFIRLFPSTSINPVRI